MSEACGLHDRFLCRSSLCVKPPRVQLIETMWGYEDEYEGVAQVMLDRALEYLIENAGQVWDKRDFANRSLEGVKRGLRKLRGNAR